MLTSFMRRFHLVRKQGLKKYFVAAPATKYLWILEAFNMRYRKRDSLAIALKLPVCNGGMRYGERNLGSVAFGKSIACANFEDRRNRKWAYPARPAFKRIAERANLWKNGVGHSSKLNLRAAVLETE